MLTSRTFLLAACCSVITALPTGRDILARAGGPAIIPIPPSCAITYPISAEPEDAGTNYKPNARANSSILYYMYYNSFLPNKTAEAERCLEQCYGYGLHTECKAAYWADNLIVPAGYYGTPGGQLSAGCVLFTRPLTAEDFEVAPEGQATHAFAGNLAC